MGARVKAVKVTPKLLVARVEVAKVAQLIRLSCTVWRKLHVMLWFDVVESDNIVLKISLARARVETVKMARLGQKGSKNKGL